MYLNMDTVISKGILIAGDANGQIWMYTVIVFNFMKLKTLIGLFSTFHLITLVTLVFFEFILWMLLKR
jgi:hypothetical protein